MAQLQEVSPQTPQEIQRRLSSAEGQECLTHFLLHHTAHDPTARNQAWAGRAAYELQKNSQDDRAKALRKVADLAKHGSRNAPPVPSSPALKDRFCLLDRLNKTGFDMILSMLDVIDLARCRQANHGLKSNMDAAGTAGILGAAAGVSEGTPNPLQP